MTANTPAMTAVMVAISAGRSRDRPLTPALARLAATVTTVTLMAPTRIPAGAAAAVGYM
jgi:hypothetical protein